MKIAVEDTVSNLNISQRIIQYLSFVFGFVKEKILQFNIAKFSFEFSRKWHFSLVLVSAECSCREQKCVKTYSTNMTA
jgi:hypothetical protein